MIPKDVTIIDPDRKGHIEKRIANLYRLPGIGDYLEAQVFEIMERIPAQDRCVWEAYMDMRNELEFQSVKAALRWGKLHYK